MPAAKPTTFLLKNVLKLLPFLVAAYMPLASAAPTYTLKVPMAGLVVASAPVDGAVVEGVQNFGDYRARPDGSFEMSCAQYRNNGYSGATGDGIYRIQLSGQAPFDVWCDMTSEGGGWTRVARQFEGSPVKWSGAINGQSYSLAESQIPSHTQIGFGQDEAATDLDYVTAKYTAGDIEEIAVSSPKSGLTYIMYRNSTYYYNNHESESGYKLQNEMWHQSLSLDRVGVTGFDWSFSPKVGTAAYQGYAYKGANYYTVEPFSWTVWVR